MRALVTGSSGLVGSAVVEHFDALGATTIGVDNNGRADFFGPAADTTWNRDRLASTCARFTHNELDIRDRAAVDALVEASAPLDLLVHCASQPSHDLAATRPFDDFDVNAVGTLNLLEALRQHCGEAVFVFMSTNKVYGDLPNRLPLVELATRWDYARPEDRDGIDESMSIDQSLHSLFGASKVAADVLVQEYGRYFDMPTVSLRCGCLTGPNHSGVPLHGFLSHLVKTQVAGERYTVLGHGGKQVRDNLHSADVAAAVEACWRAPHVGAVYNLGGGRENSCSILEAFTMVEEITGRPMRHDYLDEPRAGDHICYITDTARFRADHPEWVVSKTLSATLEEMAAFESDAHS